MMDRNHCQMMQRNWMLKRPLFVGNYSSVGYIITGLVTFQAAKYLQLVDGREWFVPRFGKSNAGKLISSI